MRFWLFLIAVLALVGLASVYVLRRASQVLRLGRRGRVALGTVLALGPLALIGARYLERAELHTASFVVGAVSATIVLGVLISTALLWVVDLPFGTLAWVDRFRARDTPEAPPERAREDPPSGEGEAPAAPSVGRRDLIRRSATGAALSLGFGSAVYGTLFGRHDYQIVEVPVAIPGLSPRLDGYRIAQLSDIHFGVYVGEPELESAVALVREARPDLVVLTGDLVDHDAAFAPQLGRLVRRIEQLGVRDGVVVIPGNHDYYAGIDAVLSAARDGGARILRNGGRVIGDGGGAFALLGVDDVWARRNGDGPGPDLNRAIAMVPRDLPRVLLCHNPEYFPHARGHVALQLSGHTHGGQVNLGVQPAQLVLPYVEGLYQEEGARLYVNRGFGTAGPPARIGAPPEVTLVVLTT